MFKDIKNTSEKLWNGFKIEFGKVYNNPNLSAFKPMHEAELPTGKKLRVFEFDDTLVKTNSFIYVKHADGKESKQTPGEYAIYEPKPGDHFDFSDFQKVTQPQEIKGVTKILKRVINTSDSKPFLEIILPDNTKHKISFDELSNRGNFYLFFDYMNKDKNRNYDFRFLILLS